MKRPRAILFDHDGVLVASESLHWAAWRTLLRDLGLRYDESLIRAAVGRTAPQILRALLDDQRPGWKPEEFDLDALAVKKNDYYLEKARTELEPYPGVREGLTWLKQQGIRSAVVSNAKRRELETALRHLALLDFFDEIISRDDIQPPKPDPAPYLFAAGRLETEVADCIAIEDAPPGLESALMARIPTAAVLTNFPRESLEHPVPGRPDLRPIWVGASIQEFFDWLRSLPS